MNTNANDQSTPMPEEMFALGNAIKAIIGEERLFVVTVEPPKEMKKGDGDIDLVANMSPQETKEFLTQAIKHNAKAIEQVHAPSGSAVHRLNQFMDKSEAARMWN